VAQISIKPTQQFTFEHELRYHTQNQLVFKVNNGFLEAAESRKDDL